MKPSGILKRPEPSPAIADLNVLISLFSSAGCSSSAFGAPKSRINPI